MVWFMDRCNGCTGRANSIPRTVKEVGGVTLGATYVDTDKSTRVEQIAVCRAPFARAISPCAGRLSLSLIARRKLTSATSWQRIRAPHMALHPIAFSSNRSIRSAIYSLRLVVDLPVVRDTWAFIHSFIHSVRRPRRVSHVLATRLGGTWRTPPCISVRIDRRESKLRITWIFPSNLDCFYRLLIRDIITLSVTRIQNSYRYI